jgi:hypothetical protein
MVVPVTLGSGMVLMLRAGAAFAGAEGFPRKGRSFYPAYHLNVPQHLTPASVSFVRYTTAFIRQQVRLISPGVMTKATGIWITVKCLTS